MESIPVHLQKCLYYVSLASQGDGEISESELDAYATTKMPKGPEVLNAFTSKVNLSFASFFSHKPGDEVSKYFLSLGWVTKSEIGKLRISTLGRHLLAGLKAEFDELNDGIVVSLSPERNLNLSTLLNEFNKVGSGLFVDKYFKSDDLGWLSSQTKISKLLVGDVNTKSKLQADMAELGETLSIQVRFDKSDHLHDRCLISDEGYVALLGTSLSGIGNKLSTLVRLNPESAAQYRQDVNSLWDKAEVLKPVAPQTFMNRNSKPGAISN